MTKILVPTDFSIYADRALKTAIKLAPLMNGQLELLHVIKPMHNWQLLSNQDSYRKIEEEIKSKYVLPLIEERKIWLEKEGVRYIVTVKSGDLYETIKQHVDKSKYDLICMGSKGSSGMTEIVVGSNTQKVLRNVTTNVLVVKEDLMDVIFPKVAFVTGLNSNERPAFIKFLETIKPFGVKDLHILCVDLNGYFNQPTIVMKQALKEFEEMVEGYEVKTHFYPSYSVESGVKHFAQEKNIDLIGISNHHKHPLKRIFNGSHVELILNHSDVPVLSIDY